MAELWFLTLYMCFLIISMWHAVFMRSCEASTEPIQGRRKELFKGNTAAKPKITICDTHTGGMFIKTDSTYKGTLSLLWFILNSHIYGLLHVL